MRAGSPPSTQSFPHEWSRGDDIAFLEWLAALGRGESGGSAPEQARRVVEFSCERCGELRTTSAPWRGAPACCGGPMVARVRRLPRRDVWP